MINDKMNEFVGYSTCLNCKLELYNKSNKCEKCEGFGSIRILVIPFHRKFKQQLFAINLKPNTTVIDLKLTIAYVQAKDKALYTKYNGLEQSEIRKKWCKRFQLIYEGQYLRKKRRICDYNLRNGSVIH